MQFSHNTSVACWRGKFIILRIGADLVRNHQSPIFHVSSILPSRVARILKLYAKADPWLQENDFFVD